MLSFASELSSISAAAESAFCSDTLFLFIVVSSLSSPFDKSARKASDVDEDAGKRFLARDKEVSSASRRGDGSFGFLFLVVIFLMPKRVWEKNLMKKTKIKCTAAQNVHPRDEKRDRIFKHKRIIYRIKTSFFYMCVV